MRTALRGSRQLVLVALLLGIAADRLFVDRSVGISALLWVGAGISGLLWLSVVEGRPPARANLWLAGAALLLAACLALRVTPVLLVLNGLALAGALLVLVGHYRGPSLFRFSAAQLAGTWLRALGKVAAAARIPGGLALRSLPVRRSQVATAVPVARGVVLAVPVVLCFGGLLASADRVFASYVADTLTLHFPFDAGSLLNHAFVALAVAWLCAGGLVVALGGPSNATMRALLPAEGDTQRLYARYALRPWLGFTEAVTVLVLVNVLFGTFMLVQGVYFFGALDSLARTGMTYADYARRGFFELLTVACLALALLGSFALATQRSTAGHGRVFNVLSLAIVALVLGMLVSAFGRMALYEQAYGFTRLRVYTHSFMIWLGVVLVLYGAALLLNRANVFVLGTLLAALVYLGGLNLVNPDALIARANLDRYAVSGKLDAVYLASLSADATPTLVRALDGISGDERAILLDSLREQRGELASAALREGWPAWSFARAAALTALESLPSSTP